MRRVVGGLFVLFGYLAQLPVFIGTFWLVVLNWEWSNWIFRLLVWAVVVEPLACCIVSFSFMGLGALIAGKEVFE